MSKKAIILISTISITLVSLMVLPALGKASNCGGNSAALSLCSSYTTSLITEFVHLEEFPNNLDLDDLSKEFKENIWASSHWTGDAKYLLRKKGINLNSGKKQIIIVTGEPNATAWEGENIIKGKKMTFVLAEDLFKVEGRVKLVLNPKNPPPEKKR